MLSELAINYGITTEPFGHFYDEAGATDEPVPRQISIP